MTKTQIIKTARQSGYSVSSRPIAYFNEVPIHRVTDPDGNERTLSIQQLGWLVNDR